MLGPELEAFEREWARLVGVPHAIGVANGMDALSLSLMSSKLEKGSEVITSPVTAAATVLAILRAGLVPVMADVDPGTGLLTPRTVERVLSNKTTAVLLVHLYGQVRGMEEWIQLCQAHQLQLFEDCAQSHLAEENGRSAGSFGLTGSFSFYPTKNLGGIGDSGMVTTQSPEIAENIRLLRNYGQRNRYIHEEIGLNSRLDEIQAAYLRLKLKSLESGNSKRRSVAQRYFNELDNPEIILLSPPSQRRAHVYHQFVVRAKNRDKLAKHLERCGIPSLIHYPTPIHRQPAFSGIVGVKDSLVHSEAFSESVLSIPCHPGMVASEIETVLNALNEFRS